MVLISKEGECFIGSFAHSTARKKLENSFTRLQVTSRIDNPKRNPFVYIHAKRVPGIYRATTVVCDPAGKNFAVTHV